MKRFMNRTDAGQKLAEKLAPFFMQDDVVVVGVAPGGVFVGHEIARAIHAPLDFLVIERLAVPDKSQAIGAVTSTGAKVLNTALIHELALTASDVERLAEAAILEARKQDAALRDYKPRPDLTGKVVILVDDGVATGISILAAARSLKAQKAREVVVAVPVIPETTIDEIRAEVDAVFQCHKPSSFAGVQNWFYDFSLPTPREVQSLLEKSAAIRAAAPAAIGAPVAGTSLAK